MAVDKCDVEEEDIGSSSSDSFINDSDSNESLTPGQDGEVHPEASRTFIHN